MSLNSDRAERGRMVAAAYDGGEDLSRLLTDLCAYADTLGPSAFENNVHIARTRVRSAT